MIPQGATSDETERALDRTHQTVSPRFTELRMFGYIEYQKQGGVPVRRTTRSGKAAYVHVATKLGKEAARLGIPIHLAIGDVTKGRHRGNPMSSAAFHEASTLRLDVLKHVVSKS